MLVVVAGGHRVGLPLVHVHETMRPLPVEPLRDAPPFVLGLSVIRGASVPVVDLGGLLGREEQSQPFLRFVTLEVTGAAFALALDAVLEVITLDERTLSALPPLMNQAAGKAVHALGLADEKFLFVLEASKLVPALASLTEGTS